MVKAPDPIDPETGVWNHVWAYPLASAEWSRSDRYHHTLAAIELEVLQPADGESTKAVAQVLRDTLRSYDVISRKGRTTFSVIACEIEPDAARRICERLKAAIDQRGVGAAFGAVTNRAERVEMVEDLFDVAWEACSRAQQGEGVDNIFVIQ